MHAINQPIATEGDSERDLCVCPSVCMLDNPVRLAKTDEPIKTPFGI